MAQQGRAVLAPSVGCASARGALSGNKRPLPAPSETTGAEDTVHAHLSSFVQHTSDPWHDGELKNSSPAGSLEGDLVELYPTVLHFGERKHSNGTPPPTSTCCTRIKMFPKDNRMLLRWELTKVYWDTGFVPRFLTLSFLTLPGYS